MNYPFIFLNGTILRFDEATISPFDRGFLHGDGLFETLRAYRGRGHLLSRHLDRLASGASFLRIELPSREYLINAVESVLRANSALDAIIRLTITRGIGDLTLDDATPQSPTILITLRPLLHIGGDEQNEKIADRGSQSKIENRKSKIPPESIITLSAHHALPGLGIRVKSLDYLTAVYSSRELREAGVREGVLLTREGIVAEGTVSNIFCVSQGIIYTPPLSLGILPGVTRGRVMELARERGMEVRETSFDHPFFLAADECFYTNSVREIVPIIRVDDRTIGTGEPGPITLALASAYSAETPLD